MSGIETRLAAGEDADSIRSAFYCFLASHGGDADGPAHIHTEIDASGARLLVRLWSIEAMDAFLGGLARSGR